MIEPMITVLLAAGWAAIIVVGLVYLTTKTRVDYVLRERRLHFYLRVFGFLPKHISFKWKSIRNIGTVDSWADIIPLVRGKVPWVYGRYQPSSAIEIILRGLRFLPIVIGLEDSAQRERFLREVRSREEFLGRAR